ncbi:hypothetical protein RRG08_022270 [Elysia crispata]|uniref:SMB domain-containing protein n=1 Tax=Elysia crispata TaxID=231223 RepID=A0AAE0ZQF9_9GAST|nr:hypothetical protein RRG08_022270 [Elysia crispata]
MGINIILFGVPLIRETEPVSGTKKLTLKAKGIILLLVLTFQLHASCAFHLEWGPDLEGPWCAKREVGEDCCTGRDDYCSVPILGTVCYCDIFCNATAYDCCPDYFPHCFGLNIRSTTPRPTTLPPPRPVGPCRAPGGREYPVGDGYKENCNTCTCVVTYTPSRRSEWSCTDHACLIRPEMIRKINDGADQYTWRASNYSSLWGMTLDEGTLYRLGTFQLDRKAQAMTPIEIEEMENLPENYDSREKWAGKLHPIQDQGNCGSSWAHSSIAVTTDRLSVLSLGYITETLSAQHLLSCDTDGQMGCEGGHVDRAWWYLKKQGVVSAACYPYKSGFTNNAGSCLLAYNQTGGICPSGIQYSKRYKSTPPYRVSGEREIMTEIFESGPVQAIMEVREDFYMYKAGVYRYTRLSQRTGESSKYRKSGFHSVRIVGWGVDYTLTGERVKYWICANSWGTEWGEDGYFRIARGVGESQIERTVIGVWVNVEGDPLQEEQLQRGRMERFRVRFARRGRGRFRSLPTGRRKRRLLRKAKLGLRRQKTSQKARKSIQRKKENNWSNLKKLGKAYSRKLSRKERKERRRARRERRRLRRQMKLKALLARDLSIHS